MLLRAAARETLQELLEPGEAISVALVHARLERRGSARGRARVERWLRIVLQGELNASRVIFAGDLLHRDEPEIDPRRHTAARDRLPVAHHALLYRDRANARQ